MNSSRRVWSIELEYGNWEDGDQGDGGRAEDIAIDVPEVSS